MLSEILLEKEQEKEKLLEEKDKLLEEYPRKIAREMLQQGLDPKIVAKVTHLPLSEIRDLQQG